MPKLSGIEAARMIKSNCPEIKILILSMHKEKEYISEAFSAGVEGYLLTKVLHFITPIVSRDKYREYFV
jgi:DNA-binding NarL/FixJ family response regulator